MILIPVRAEPLRSTQGICKESCGGVAVKLSVDLLYVVLQCAVQQPATMLYIIKPAAVKQSQPEQRKRKLPAFELYLPMCSRTTGSQYIRAEPLEQSTMRLFPGV